MEPSDIGIEWYGRGPDEEGSDAERAQPLVEGILRLRNEQA
jgi:hypothetical protein